MHQMKLALGLAMASIGTMACISPPVVLTETADTSSATSLRKARRRLAAVSKPKERRSRGQQAKPKRKSNRLHISRRTRAKHRRAA